MVERSVAGAQPAVDVGMNGAAGTLGSFMAILISMDLSIGFCVLTGAGCYLLAGLAMPAKAT
jgi:hypothetical protein